MPKRKHLPKIPRKASAMPPSLPPPPWDMGASGPANRIGLVTEERGEVGQDGKMRNPNQVRGVRRVDMLEVWAREKVIGNAGYNAALALRAAFENTQRSPGTSFEQDRVDSSPKPDHAVTIAIDRISGFHKVNQYLAAPDRALVHHCILNGGTPATFRSNGARPFYGPEYLRGLEELGKALERFAKALERGK